MAEFLSLDPEQREILAVTLGSVIYLLLAWSIYLWVRRILRAWVKRTETLTDDKIVAVAEHSLLPMMVLGAAYLLFSFISLPMSFEVVGRKVFLASMIILVLMLGGRLSLLFLDRLGGRYGFAEALAQRARGPVWAVLSVLLFHHLATYTLGLSESAQLRLYPIITMILIVSFAWLLVRGVALAADIVQQSYGERLKNVDAIRARSFETQVSVSRRVADFVIVLIATGVALSQFELFQTLGKSLLASAGVAGLVIGLAAQRTLGNMFSGVQLAVTQPIRIGDYVAFEGAWGWIEEISLTYVVIRIWDLRRLVIPINYLLERPIQNWTRASPALIGIVYVYTDYRVDVEAVRKELGNILESTNLWDRKTPPILQVTDCKQDTIELWALCSAANASDVWDLRCFVREKLLAYIQGLENGKFLPRTRLEFEGREIGVHEAA